MEIIAALSGATVARLDEDELRCMVEAGQGVGNLKQHLSAHIGYTRFQQRLLNDTIELEDDMPLQFMPTVQLVVLNFSPADEILAQQLLSSCEHNMLGKLQRLLKMPLNPNVRDRTTQDTALHIGAHRGRAEFVRLLLEAGADKDAKNAYGATALHLAAQRSHLEVVRLLLEAGADTDAAKTNDGMTALHFAALHGHLEVVRLLLEAGADTDAAKTNDGMTALHFAALHGHFEVVRLLLEAGADKDAENADGATALRIAAEKGHLEVVRLLQEAGAAYTVLEFLSAAIWNVCYCCLDTVDAAVEECSRLLCGSAQNGHL